MKKSLCIGINHYENEPLNGCVNDARDWHELLKRKFSFNVPKFNKLLINEEATKSRILNEFKFLITNLQHDDIAIFVFSGHGNYKRDQKYGDERDGFDEVIVDVKGLYIKDDCFRFLINNAEPKGKMIFIFDSCFSGTMIDSPNPYSKKIDLDKKYHSKSLTFSTKKRKDIKNNSKLNRLLNSSDNFNEILISACKHNRKAYEFELAGKWNGVLTNKALEAINELNELEISYEQLMISINKMLLDKPIQEPQIYGNDNLKREPLFK